MNTTIQIRKKGSLTLPMALRTKYGVDEGDVFTLIDLGDGSFLLTPRLSQVNRLGNRIAEMVDQAGYTVDDLLNGLEEDHEVYYIDHYVNPRSSNGKQ